MKFDEALVKTLEEIMPQVDGAENVISPQTAKILSLIWNIIALADGKFDDYVYIDKHNSIMSIDMNNKKDRKPVEGEKTPKKQKGRKSKAAVGVQKN